MDSSINSYWHSKSDHALLPLVLIELVLVSLLFLEQYFVLAGLLGIGIVVTLLLVPRYALFVALTIAYSGVAATILQGLFLPAILLAGLAWFTNFLKDGKLNFRAAPQNGLFVLFLVWMLFSTLYARDVDASFVDIYIYFKYLIFYFLIINILSEWSDIKELFWVLVLTGIIMLGFGIYTFITSTNFIGTRLISFIEDPNSFAIKLTPLVAFCYTLFKIEETKILKLISIIAGLIIIFAIVLTFSRGGLLALLSVLGLIIIEEVKYKKLVLFIAGSLTLVLSIIFILKFTQTDSIAFDVSIIQRLRILKGGVQMFFDHPILGVGVGNFVNYCSGYSGIIIGLVAHNSFLHIAAEMGIIGLVIFTLLFTTTVSNLRSTAKHFRNSKNVYYIKGIMFSLAGFTVHSMFLSEQYNISFFLIIALTVVLKNVALNTKKINL